MRTSLGKLRIISTSLYLANHSRHASVQRLPEEFQAFFFHVKVDLDVPAQFAREIWTLFL